MFRKALLATAVCVLLLPVAARSQETKFFLEQQLYSYYGDGGGSGFLQLDALATHTVNDRWGVYGWLLVNKNWAQAYFGPTYSPTSWLQAGVAAGVEQDDNSNLRYGSLVFVGGDSYLLLINETGGSGWWYHYALNIKLNDDLGIGAIAERYLGMGPRYQVRVPSTPLVLWGSPALYDNNTDTWNALTGVRLNF